MVHQKRRVWLGLGQLVASQEQMVEHGERTDHLGFPHMRVYNEEETMLDLSVPAPRGALIPDPK